MLARVKASEGTGRDVGWIRIVTGFIREEAQVRLRIMGVDQM